MNFWQKIQKPILVMAPMADVTDMAFRALFAKYGKPDVIWTEFVSADGLNSRGKENLLIDLKFNENEHPIVAQLFSSNPENMEKAAALCQELGFDGIDINMGCPDKTIEKQGAGAGMIKNPKKAQEVIRATMKGAPNLPVSVKTRVGYNKVEIDTWISAILETKPAVLTVHLRTRKEMSLVPARWEHMKEVIALRDTISPDTLILGNGDVPNLIDAFNKVKEYKVDGVMIGRGIFGNPWTFKDLQLLKERFLKGETLSTTDLYTPTTEEKLKTLVEHTKLFEDTLGNHKSFAIMKKHFKAYVNNFDGAGELRNILMQKGNSKEIKEVVDNYLTTF